MFKLNENFFDTIDTEEKAYWLGFIWCDGYVCKRERLIKDKVKLEYNIKLSLSPADESHLEKFKKSLDSTHPIHTYKFKGFNGKESDEKRIFITNIHMGKTLQEKYNLVPRRDTCSFVKNIPNHLIKHFIRGILDADGSLADYYTMDEKWRVRKMTVSFTTCIELLKFIENHFYSIGLSNTINYKKYKRHKEDNRDIDCLTLNYSGKKQAINIVNYLYKDATIYLDRKYEKYLNMIN